MVSAYSGQTSLKTAAFWINRSKQKTKMPFMYISQDRINEYSQSLSRNCFGKSGGEKKRKKGKKYIFHASQVVCIRMFWGCQTSVHNAATLFGTQAGEEPWDALALGRSSALALQNEPIDNLPLLRFGLEDKEGQNPPSLLPVFFCLLGC